MLTKIALLLLVAFAVLGIFGRTRFPPSLGGRPKPRTLGSVKTCPKCGRHKIGKDDCSCGKGA